MGLVGTWTRQIARAAGASLIAPLVLLLAAGVVASGGGLGGLDSLGQIASGPSLPNTGLPKASRSTIESAELVGTAPPASGPARSTAPPTAIASAAPPGAAPSRARAAAAPRTEVGSSAGPVAGGRPGARGEGTLVEEPTTTAPPAAPPGDELQETTEGLGESIAEPLRPVGNQLLDLLRLLGLPPPR